MRTHRIPHAQRRDPARVDPRAGTRVGAFTKGDELAAIVASSYDAIIGMTSDGIVTSWNPAAERLYGYSAAEAIGQPIGLITPPDRADEPATIMARIRRGERVEPYETVRVRKDGRRVEVSLTVSPIRDASGAVVGASGIARDVTERVRAEQALREGEERFRTLADNIAQLAWMADSTGWIFWYNRRWFEYTGTTLEEMEGWGWTKVHHPDHVDRVVERIRRSWETGEPWEDTFPLRGKDGRYRWFLSRALPIRGEDGSIVRWFGTNTDITDRLEAEAGLARLAAIVESSQDAILGLALDGTITHWNPGAERLYGYAAAEAIGRPITLIVPEDRAGELEPLLRQLLSSERVEPYETQRVTKDGRRVDVSVSLSPVIDARGRTTGAAIIARDVSARVRAEAALRESEARLRAVLETALDCVITIDSQSRILEFNPAAERTFGRRREDVLRQPLPELIIPERLREAHRRGLAHYLATGEGPLMGRRVEIEALRADGSEFPVELAITRISGEGEPLFTAYLRDITERKRAEEEREELLAIVAHDLKTPLTVIKGNADMLGRHAAAGRCEAERVENRAAAISTAAGTMTAQIGELLDLARLRAGEPLELVRAPTDLVALVYRVAGQAQATTTRHTVEVDAGVAELVGNWDAMRLERVLGNLLGNAVKYSPEGGEVVAAVRREERDGQPWAFLSVTDHGVGIPAADLPRLFERYHRAANVLGRIPGEGIGLAGAKQVVEQHGGTIEVESREGEGSTFTVGLPLGL